MKTHPPPESRPFRIDTASLGPSRPEIDLDKALGLAGRLEDLEIIRKVDLQKRPPWNPTR